VQKPKLIYKIVLLAATDVKKRLLEQLASQAQMPFIATIGIDFSIYETDQAKFQIWDMAGQERFARITAPLIRGAHTTILCPADSQDCAKRLKDLVSLTNDNTYPGIILVATDDEAIREIANAANVKVIDMPRVDTANQFFKDIISSDKKTSFPSYNLEELLPFQTILAQETDLPTAVVSLIAAYLPPFYLTLPTTEFLAQAENSNTHEMLVHTAAVSEDPVWHVRAYLASLSNKHPEEDALPHLKIARKLILDPEVDVTEDTMKQIQVFLISRQADLTILQDAFKIRKHRASQFVPGEPYYSSISATGRNSFLRATYPLVRNEQVVEYKDQTSPSPTSHGSTTGSNPKSSPALL
jgi:signal recognition particle receptor subunit beta